MSAANLLSSLKDKSTTEENQDGPSQEGHENSGASPGGGGGGGGGDPAVLCVGPARRPLVYTRDELMRLRASPLVKQGLEQAFLGCDALALVLKKRSDSPNEEDRGAKGDAPNDNHKGVYGRERERRAADPRERVRAESSPGAGGIVLSPQRRSFTSGCGAPPPHDAPPPPPQQPKIDPVRRIGSGRIMVRDAAATGYEENEFRDQYRQPRTNGDRYDRRSFGRDSYSSEIKRERDDRFNNEKPHREDNRRSGGRFSQRRFEKEDEPEWFSGGPTSQLETIELRGFDDPPTNNKQTDNTNTKHKDNKKWNSNGGSSSPNERWREQNAASPTPNNNNEHDTTNHEKEQPSDQKAKESTNASDQQPDFNLDDFLKLDSIGDVLTNGGGESEGGSRFSRWFRRESPTNDNRHYERLLHNIVDDLEKPIQEGNPGRQDGHVFAPISPPHHMQRNSEHDMRSGVGSGRMQSLEELEARLRPQQNHPDHDLSAFKRLLAQVSGGHAVPAEQRQMPQQQPQPMSLLQMLNKSMEQQKQQQQQQQQQPHIPQDLLYKLLQVQQRQQQQQQAAAGGADLDLLQRPEAQAIIHGLKAGEITVQHLMQQLGNPGLQSRHRELLLTILRLHQHQRQMGGSPLPSGGSHLVVPSHHQPLRLSPLPHPAFCVSPIMAASPNTLAVHHPGVPARIPSPRELAAHTQSIMQGALIKKKLEEQRENFRRRQEMQQQPKQPTPISFTPTSVLRKMTAEKESEAPSPKQQQQWAQPPKMPQGRPIVKGNQSGAPPSMGYAPSPADYQQHYLNQQQMGGVRQFSHPQQQRQQIPTSMNSMNNMSRGMGGGSTLHQLLVQSHQRTLNEMSGVGVGGGDNQLARWFSPELLARASAGKLPSVHVPNALSLEDLERHHHSPAPPLRN